MATQKATNASPELTADMKMDDLRLMQAVNQALSFLLQNDDTDRALANAFRLICEAMGCDGVYLFDYAQIEADKIVSSVRFGLRLLEGEWRQTEKEIIEFPLESQPIQDRVAAMMGRDATTIALSEETPPALQALLQRMDVASYLSFRIVIDGNVWGGVSFVSRERSVDWAINKRELLLPFVSNLGNYLERKKAEQALKAQRDYLKQIIDSSPNPIYAKNEKGEFTLVNEAMAKLHGKVPAEMEGRSIFDFYEDKAAVEKAREEDLQILKEGKPRLDMLREIFAADGMKQYLQISKVPVKRADSAKWEIFTTITDITDIKRTEDRLRAERNFSESITSTIPDWVLLVDLEKRAFAYSNIQFPALGYEASETASLFELLVGRLHPDDRHLTQSFIQALETMTDGDVAEKYFRLQHKNGEWLHFYERAKVFSRHPDGRLKEYLAVIQDVTSNVQTQQQLAESKQRYKNFIAYSYDGIYYLKFDKPIPLDIPADDQVNMYYKYGYIDECNAAFARMYGEEDPARLVGLRVYDAHKGEHFELNRQETLKFIQNNYRAVNSESIEPGADGALLYLLNHAIGDIKDGQVYGIWGTQQDITERRKAEKALQESKNLLQGIINALPDLKFKINREGIFLDYFESENESEAPMVPAVAFLGKKVVDVLPDYIAGMGMQSIRESLFDKTIKTFEYTLLVHGELCYYEGRVSPVGDDEVILVVRNISESKRAKNELQKRLQELDEKNQELRQYIESNFQLENFAYIASHDLREPVRNMHNFAQMLQRNYGAQLDEKGQRHLQFIIDSALRMNALIEDLLEYSRISSEQIKYEQIELERLLNVVSSDIYQLIQHKKAEIYVGQMPETIKGSRTQIKQLFQNLLTNAVKFHRDGVPPVVTIRGISHDEHWLFEVKDNGRGIPREKYEEVFQLFKRLQQDKDSHGTGIGLAICQRIAKHHHGKIWVESEPGKGSAFYFTIKKEPEG